MSANSHRGIIIDEEGDLYSGDILRIVSHVAGEVARIDADGREFVQGEQVPLGTVASLYLSGRLHVVGDGTTTSAPSTIGV